MLSHFHLNLISLQGNLMNTQNTKFRISAILGLVAFSIATTSFVTTENMDSKLSRVIGVDPVLQSNEVARVIGVDPLTIFS